jgi:hypothetical protein
MAKTTRYATARFQPGSYESLSNVINYFLHTNGKVTTGSWGKDNFALLKRKQTYLAVEEVSYLRTSHCVHQALLRQFISFCHVFRQTEKKPENVVFYVLIILYMR